MESSPPLAAPAASLVTLPWDAGSLRHCTPAAVVLWHNAELSLWKLGDVLEERYLEKGAMM